MPGKPQFRGAGPSGSPCLKCVWESQKLHTPRSPHTAVAALEEMTGKPTDLPKRCHTGDVAIEDMDPSEEDVTGSVCALG